MTSAEESDDVETALREIVRELGPDALADSGAMAGLLYDLLPNAPRETGILLAAADVGLASSLRSHVSEGMDVQTAMSATTSLFISKTMFSPEACSWVVGEIARALGLGPVNAGPRTPLPAGFDAHSITGQEAVTVKPGGHASRHIGSRLSGRLKIILGVGVLAILAAGIWISVSLAGHPHGTAGAYRSARAVIAALRAHQVPCRSVSYLKPTATGARSLAECSGASSGDTSIVVFASHQAASAFAHRMLSQASIFGPTEEVVGSDWVVNTGPAYGIKVAAAIGGTVLKAS